MVADNITENKQTGPEIGKKGTKSRMMVIKTLQTRAADVHLQDDGLLYIDVFPKAEIIKKDAEEILDAIVSVSDGIRYPLLIDGNSLLSVDRDSRKLFSTTPTVSAVALVVGTPLGKIIGNFFVGLNKTDMPFKLFTSKTEAFEWLEAYKK